MKRIVVILSAALLASCATPPSEISPTPVAGTPFAEHDCDMLKSDRAQYVLTLEEAKKTQNQRVSADVIGVLLIGVPFGTLGPSQDKAQVIGTLRGYIDEIDKEAITKQCVDPVFGSEEPKPVYNGAAKAGKD